MTLQLWASEPVKFRNLRPGLFLFDGGHVGFKSEYHTITSQGSQADAYVVESGEYFAGGVLTAKMRDELAVQPLEVVDVPEPDKGDWWFNVVHATASLFAVGAFILAIALFAIFLR
jgi:hypothetical protein